MRYGEPIVSHPSQHLHVSTRGRRRNTTYDRYMDDCFTKWTTNAPGTLLGKLNSYHPNIMFTVEENADYFLDTSFNHQEGNFTTRVYQNQSNKLQVHWKSAIP